ncbi:MAG: hypothetical protein JMN24_03185 [gamma proteobacterium endosymbiont of Lamellibrachia anaximandri]|nr:hypothetical protein [gamma proteobacterium endosymbiont of Lamellibrachia anaximandri]MBL3617103.1 hypothetical protein [gamma proteobacterium endosymbiont of Lamellibrachia anaximandri]
MDTLPQKNKAYPPESNGIVSELSLRLMPQLREQLQFRRDAGCDAVPVDALANHISSPTRLGDA